MTIFFSSFLILSFFCPNKSTDPRKSLKANTRFPSIEFAQREIRNPSSDVCLMMQNYFILEAGVWLNPVWKACPLHGPGIYHHNVILHPKLPIQVHLEWTATEIPWLHAEAWRDGFFRDTHLSSAVWRCTKRNSPRSSHSTQTQRRFHRMTSLLSALHRIPVPSCLCQTRTGQYAPRPSLAC